MLEIRPGPTTFADNRVLELRRALTQYGATALRALDAAPPDAPLGPATALAKQATHRLLQLLDPSQRDGTTQAIHSLRSPARILSRDLLYVTDLDLDANFDPAAAYTSADAIRLLTNTAEHATTMPTASDRRLRRANFAGVRLACDDMEHSGDPEFGRCHAALQQGLTLHTRQLTHELARAKEATEQAFSHGQLSDHERDRLSERIAKAQFALRENDAIEQAQAHLATVRRSIESSGATLLAELNQRFEATSEQLSGPDRAAITRCIADGDVVAANELLSGLSAQPTIALPAVAPDDPFTDFLAIADQLPDPNDPNPLPNAVVEAAATRKPLPGFSFASLTPAQAHEAEALLNRWYHISTRRTDGLDALEELLSLLGFQVREQKKLDAGRGWLEMSVSTAPIQDRATCPLPHFGSDAKGRYRVLLHWSGSPSLLLSRTIGTGVTPPTLLIHFAHLGADRERLRNWAVAKRRPFLVFDESLIWYLSTKAPADRLATLFRCACSFTAIDPYVTTSSLVPPELFYGREDERQRIMDPYGTCFLFGGRQLGKTALLRSVERDFYAARSRHLAKWIDLKAADIGYGRPPEDIWAVLWQELHELPVLANTPRRPAAGNQSQVEAMIADIQQWITNHDGSRVLLLLDEADAFLQADAGTDFRESTRLKGLMDRTDRRFKAVLAGLHNVLRTTRLANHPLAHFGQPLSVGPLRWTEAHGLVCDPLQSIGCRFERQTLGTRILAHTNYYPSLIQLYGAQLVGQLRHSQKAFPYVVTSGDVDAAYRDTGLRSAIRERFLWTLHLDQRYEVLAYALAHHLLAEGADIDCGVDRRRLSADATFWWDTGFRGTTDREFDVLLDELAGLGVLRALDEGRRYTLRNPNILLLLGNIDDVERELTKPREVQDAFDPSTVHPRFGGSKSSAKYSPLTHEQVGLLVRKGGISVISGTKNAHIDYVAEHLSAQRDELFTRLPLLTTLQEFARELRAFRPRSLESTTVLLAPLGTPWTCGWIGEAKKAFRRKKHGHILRLVFLADPQLLWYATVEPTPLRDRDIDWCPVRPWHDRFLRRWLDDNRLPSDRHHRQELQQVTGGWPVVLERFLRRRRNSDWKTRIEAIRLELTRDAERRRLLDAFGISEPPIYAEMQTLCNLASAYADDTVQDVAEEAKVSADEVRLRMAWARRLGLCSEVRGEWTFNPLVTQLLNAG